MNRGIIETIYNRQVEEAIQAYEAAITRAKERRSVSLAHLEEEERADFRAEQEFFFQG